MRRLGRMSPSEVTYFLGVGGHHKSIWCKEEDIVLGLRKECYSQKGSDPALLEARCLLAEELAKHCPSKKDGRYRIRWNGEKTKPLRF